MAGAPPPARSLTWTIARMDLRQLWQSPDFLVPMVVLAALFFVFLPAVLLLAITHVHGSSLVAKVSNTLELLPKSVNAQIIPEAKKREVVSQVNVVGVGVISAKRESASVMVYMNRTVTDKSRQPLYDGSRLRVDFKKIGEKWLIAYITPI